MEENMKASLNDERKPDNEVSDMSLATARIQKPIKTKRKFNKSGIMQHYDDKFLPYVRQRWLFTLALLTIYIIRVCIVGRFGCATAFLGFQIVTLFVSTKRPIDDVRKFREGEVDLEAMDGSKIESSDEAKPFIPLCSEHAYWLFVNTSICLYFVATFFECIDIPVSCFWTVTMWIILFLSMSRDLIARGILKFNLFSLVKQGCPTKKSKSRGF